MPSWAAELDRGKNQNKPSATGYTYGGVYVEIPNCLINNMSFLTFWKLKTENRYYRSVLFYWVIKFKYEEASKILRLLMYTINILVKTT